MHRSLARSAARSLRLAAALRPLLIAAPRASLPSLARPQPTMQQRSASSTTPHSSTIDPQELAAQEQLDQGTDALAQGDFNKALEHYKHSVQIKETAIGYYNIGVVQYQLRDLAGSISSFEASLAHTPAGVKPTLPDPTQPIPELSPALVILADTHTNLGAAYILTKPPQPEKALEHLQKALMINPDDGEVCYNLAAVLEATGELDEALVAYERAQKLGIQRAELNIKNISAKILGKKREEAEKAQSSGGSVSASDVGPQGGAA